MTAKPNAPPQLAVVVPVHNEAGNIAPLIDEIRRTLDGRYAYEIVYVDDASGDSTAAELAQAAARFPAVRVITHRRRSGQSAAIWTGVKAARAPVIATLDGDGQNDPADIPGLVGELDKASDKTLLLVAGLRARRRDTWAKRISSRIANGVRSRLLGDDTPDTGCGLKVFARAAFLDMPRFDHMHRFLPALMLCRGGAVISVPVNHRARGRGSSNYGVVDRLGVGIVDLLGVMWLLRRGMVPDIEPGAADEEKDR